MKKEIHTEVKAKQSDIFSFIIFESINSHDFFNSLYLHSDLTLPDPMRVSQPIIKTIEDNMLINNREIDLNDRMLELGALDNSSNIKKLKSQN